MENHPIHKHVLLPANLVITVALASLYRLYLLSLRYGSNKLHARHFVNFTCQVDIKDPRRL